MHCARFPEGRQRSAVLSALRFAQEQNNGFLTPGWRPGTGTYSVNPDCTGTATLTIPGMGDLHLQMIVAQGGNTIHQVVIDPGIATSSDGERVKAPQQ